MNLKNAARAISLDHPEDTLLPLTTVWGEQLNKNNPLPEYPRPQLMRRDYHSLNGPWDYCITKTNQKQPGPGIESFSKDGDIIVPFSPEAALSGVNHILQPDEYLWYQKKLCFSQSELAGMELLKRRCLLHFGGVDQEATVYINGREVCSHVGGYLAFTVDLTDYIQEGALLLQMRVRDDTDTGYYSRGKQTLRRGGMFYTSQSGIWQTVWYEWVPESYITQIELTPSYEEGLVELRIHSSSAFENLSIKVAEATAEYRDNLWEAAEQNNASLPLSDATFRLMNHLTTSDGSVVTTVEILFPDEDFLAWTPETPYLYPLEVTTDEDCIHSYFAMRCFTVEDNDLLAPVFCLNHEPLFLHGILDQGYWPDGLMTAPADEAFVYDIELAKQFGFNMIRKHLKIEPLRWYYHCDRLGMLVWQDMVNGGERPVMPFVCYLPTLLTFVNGLIKDTKHRKLFSRTSQAGRDFFEEECHATIRHLYNVPSIAVWVPFNEGWGQFDSARIAENIAHQDSTRLVDHASGWFDQKAGDFRSVHNYFRKLKVEKQSWRAFCISEYGGYACHIPGHSSVERIFGYRKYDTTDALSEAYHRLIQDSLLPLAEQGLSGAVYTQVSDVEEEVNGLVTYDRKVVKIQPPF